MEKRYTYKLQGDGRNSWKCEEIVNDEIVNIYMVYENEGLTIEKYNELLKINE